MVNEFIVVFERDLDRLRQEVEAFEEEGNLWIVSGQVTNPAGNLCLHLAGNLKTYIGKNLGNYNYERNRDAEFNLKNVPRQELLSQVDETKKMVLATLRNLEDRQLKEKYPSEPLGFEMTIGYFMVHLTAHLSYHLGQLNYLRRILEKG